MIFQTSYEEGELVDDWKSASIKALFKKGSRDNPSNYRPISLTCISCKLMEKLVRDSIVNYMTLNKLFSDAQYGFRSLRLRALQLLDVMETWTDWIDEAELQIIFTVVSVFTKQNFNLFSNLMSPFSIGTPEIQWLFSIFLAHNWSPIYL